MVRTVKYHVFACKCGNLRVGGVEHSDAPELQCPAEGEINTHRRVMERLEGEPLPVEVEIPTSVSDVPSHLDTSRASTGEGMVLSEDEQRVKEKLQRFGERYSQEKLQGLVEEATKKESKALDRAIDQVCDGLDEAIRGIIKVLDLREGSR